MDRHRWRDEAFLTAATAWVDARLDERERPRTGAVDQVHVAPWSTVLRVPTGSGTLWFKANDGSLRHEAAVVSVLAARCPDTVPGLVAADTGSGWMLMEDAGEMLRSVIPRERSLDRWLDALRICAELQIACAEDVPALLAAGTPDLRSAVLPARYDELLARVDAEPRFSAAAGEVRRLAEELAAYGIAETVNHDDLHDGQVFVKDGRHLLMDWGDACLSHPFLVLSVPLEGVIAWGLDDEPGSEDLGPYLEAYLGPYAAAYPALSADDLHSAARTALRLGWACRAVNGHVPGEEAQTLTRLRMFLDGRP